MHILKLPEEGGKSFFAWILIALTIPCSSEGQVQLTNAFPNLSFTSPLFLTHAGDGTNRVFVVQQNGDIHVFPNDSAAASSTVFLNIRNKLSSTFGEEGLLGLAFHPDYESNGYFYVNYTAPSPLRTIVARYSVTPGDPNKADSLSEHVILTVNQPFTNHNGGMVLFGTDGYLYIAMGDGGSSGDPQNHGQTLQSLLGKILRVDIDTTIGAQQYGIPPTNPFYGNPSEGQEEIFAWGVRNPWRFSEDELTGILYMGDVGQNNWEEVDILENGFNYGWRCYEGNVPYNTSGCGPMAEYDFPIKVYSHSGGNCSVTGGYVYRGYRRPELTGAYIYADYCSGRTWLLRYENGQVMADSLLIDAPFAVSSFGMDQDGELYICNYGGNIQRFVGNPPSLPSIPCDSIDMFQARCVSGGTIQARVVLLNSTQYAGEEVTISVDDVDYDLTVITNGTHSKAQVLLNGQTPGLHTVELKSPAGCFNPVDVACAVGGEKAEPWEWDFGSSVENMESVTHENDPSRVILLGNYPNPSNPSTEIHYELPKDLFVNLEVVNTLGQRVSVLVNEFQNKGFHKVTFDARGIGSGVYFYRLTAGDFVGIRKILLLR